MEINIVKNPPSKKCKDLPPGTIVRIKAGYHWLAIIPSCSSSFYAIINEGCSGNITGSNCIFNHSSFYHEVPYEIVGQISLKI
jgi:hypothetical protein